MYLKYCKQLLVFLVALVPVGANAQIWSSVSLPDQMHEFQTGMIMDAQFTIEFGNSSGGIKRLLESQGYTEVQITKRKLTSVRAQACYRGSRYVVKVKTIGGIINRVSKIGECRPTVSAEDLTKQLKQDGYRRISIEDSNSDGFKILACRNKKRIAFRFDEYGRVVDRKDLGRCRDQLDVAEIKQRLRQDGYNRIDLINQENRRFRFRACRGTNRFDIRVGRKGRIQVEDRIGRCSPPIEARQLREIVENRGYDRVVVIDRKLPVYGVEACQESKLMQLSINRYGEIKKVTRIGKCDPPLNSRQITALLRETGANRIEVESLGRRGFITRSCLKLVKYRNEFDVYGASLERTRIGKCAPPPRLTKVVRDFRNDDYSNLRIIVEGCRNGRRIQTLIDEFGEIKNRRRVGTCRK